MINIVFFGTPEFAVPSLERLVSDPQFSVLGVVTQPDKRRGRGNQLTPSPVKSVALAHNLPIWQPSRIKKSPETLEQLAALKADVFVVVAYGQILSQQILEMPRLGCVNAHGSILPRYRGAAPIQWCLHQGETETGITTMLMDAGMDTGPMLLKGYTPISLLDTAQALGQRLADLSADLLVETLVKLDQQTIVPEPQNNDLANYAPLIQKADYCLDWQHSALELHNQIRGFFPYCQAQFRGEPLKILSTVPLSPEVISQLPSDFTSVLEACQDVQGSQPGEVVKLVKSIGPVIQTGSGLLLLREIQLSGKRPQSGWDFANGTRLTVGELLASGTVEGTV